MKGNASISLKATLAGSWIKGGRIRKTMISTWDASIEAEALTAVL